MSAVRSAKSAEWFRTAPLSLGLLVFLSLTQLAGEPAPEQALILSWRPVRGAFGYVMEVRDYAGAVKTLRVSRSQVELKLRPGDYSIRLAGLNKFRKPGAWSDWRTFQISAIPAGRKSEPARLNLDALDPKVAPSSSKAAEKAEATKTEAAKTEKPADGGRLFEPAWLVPGLSQWMAGERIRGATIGLLFLGSAALGFERLQSARDMAADPTRQPALWMAGLSTVRWDDVPVSGFVLREQLHAGQAQVRDRELQAQRAGGAAVLFYALHLADLAWTRSRSTAGHSDFRWDVSWNLSDRRTQTEEARWSISVSLRF